MAELNGITPTHVVRIDNTHFSIGDTSQLSEYKRGGIVKRVRDQAQEKIPFVCSLSLSLSTTAIPPKIEQMGATWMLECCASRDTTRSSIRFTERAC